MKVTMITFCLIGAIFANPISFNVIFESSDLNANTTESMSISQSSENDTSEIQSSEESSSNQVSSESESLESTSEDKTSEESDSQSDETDSMVETRDNSMGSEENVRKSWVRVFTSVIKVHSAEDNSSTEVKDQSEPLTKNQPTHTSTSTIFRQMTNTAQGHSNLPLVDKTTDSSDSNSDSTSDSTSDSADTSNITGLTAATNDSSESTSSESKETSEASVSSDASESTEDSNASDSTELNQIKTKDCVNGTQSCESDEYFFQDIGDDAHYLVGNLMAPDEDDRELSLRR